MDQAILADVGSIFGVLIFIGYIIWQIASAFIGDEEQEAPRQSRPQGNQGRQPDGSKQRRNFNEEEDPFAELLEALGQPPSERPPEPVVREVEYPQPNLPPVPQPIERKAQYAQRKARPEPQLRSSEAKRQRKQSSRTEGMSKKEAERLARQFEQKSRRQSPNQRQTAEVFAMLRNQKTLRQAVIIREILGKPIALSSGRP